jgi:diguanylate cyclase (GGDEF)-like protein
MRSSSERTIAGLSPAAAALEFAVVWLTVVGVALIGWPEEITDDQWLAFCILLPLIAIVHLVGEERQKHQGSHLSLAPIFAAVLILPPALAAIAIALAFFPESIRSRPRWYIAVFNIANFVGPALLARVVFDALPGTSDQEWAFAALVSIAAFITVHYAVLAAMLRLARGVRISDTIRLDCVLIDTGLVSLGALAAALWEVNEALVVLTVAPLALAYRSLVIPSLLEATRIEPKTGLYNMRHFTGVVSQELQRAARFDRPIAVLMVDVDHLRDVTSAHGHVGGDRALRHVAASLIAATREYDLAARFGGDEFCVLLPETELEGALLVADRIRTRVEQGTEEPRITVSVGVAAHRGGGITPDELIALADRAAYRAKFSGRNTVGVPPSGDPVHEAEKALLDALES